MAGTRLNFFLVALLCCGCSAEHETPRDRLGALPFPGHFTLYAAADPAHLGRHRYERMPRAMGEDEKERGIIYTTRAGFIDLAHVRIAIDWTRYCTRAAHGALAGGHTALAVPGPDHGVFHVTLDYPDGWADLPADERRRAIDAASLRVGQRVTYLMLTWHEVATWFGYRSFFFDESRSAFTYDDTVATLLGMRVAERAMAAMGGGGGDRDGDFDTAVTTALAAELGRLGPVAPAQTDQAVAAVAGVWWSDAGPLKRQTDVWPGEVQVVHPWLVPNLPFAAGAGEAETFELPCERAEAVDARTAVTVRIAIDPRIGEAAAMRAVLAGRPQWFSEERDVLALIDVMRGQMRERYGADFGRPWPGGAAAAVAAHSAK